MIDPLTIFAAFAPAIIDAGKALVQRYIAPDTVKPLTISERLQLDQSTVDRLRALADLDKMGENVSPWVQDVRAIMRPTVAVCVTLKWCISPQSVALDFMVSSVWFYLFGERTLRK